MRTVPFCLSTALTLLLPVGLSLPKAHAAPPSRELLQQQLIHAVIQDQPKVVQALLKKGGDPNARVAPGKEDAWALENQGDDDPAPPLIVLASRYGGFDTGKVLEALLHKGADVNIADRNGVTPLMPAAGLGFNARLLLEHGAKVNVKDHNGRTPLMYAMNNLGLNTAAALLEKGADINAQDNSGRTPLMIAILEAVHNPIILIMEDQKRKAKEEKESYLELIGFLIEKKADVNHKDKAGNTALTLAAAERQPEVAELLRKAGAKE